MKVILILLNSVEEKDIQEMLKVASEVEGWCTIDADSLSENDMFDTPSGIEYLILCTRSCDAFNFFTLLTTIIDCQTYAVTNSLKNGDCHDARLTYHGDANTFVSELYISALDHFYPSPSCFAV